MAAGYEKRKCPREAFIRASIPSGTTKQIVLHNILKYVMTQLDIKTATDAAVDSLVKKYFANTAGVKTMFPFEREEEAKRMSLLIQRWADYERNNSPQSRVLSRNFANPFYFAGKLDTYCTAHWLIDRGPALEAVRFKYKKPEYSFWGRTPETRPQNSAELLMLQRNGEAEASRLGVCKPVFGAIYYLKNKNDKGDTLAAFNNKVGANIISYHFENPEASVIEKNYSFTVPDVAQKCDAAMCQDCPYYDLCYVEFEKRQLMEQPAKEQETPDTIHLTDAQSVLVGFKTGECRVNAVAGSGKTTVIALRTLSLVKDGVDPAKILMMTFSEKAKTEMLVRLRRFADSMGRGNPDRDINVENVEIETFNSWGQHILDKYYPILGFHDKPCLVDEVKKKDIIIDLLDAHRGLPLDYRNPFLNTRASEGAVVKMGKWIDAMKASHVETPDDVREALKLSRQIPVTAQELLDIYNEYNSRLLAIHAIDYEDQLRLLLKLADFGIFEKMKYEHIVIDEFQDSNPNQIAIILELKKRNPGIKSLVVVGDELQAIYGFRNATPDNLVSFSDYFPHMIDIDMTANFRSQQPIIQMANKIIQRTARLGKLIEAQKNSLPVKPVIMQIQNEETEQDLFARQVRKFIRQGIRPSSIAVLCRTRAELLKQQSLLDKAGVPTILKVPEIMADSPYVKAIIALASFLCDNSDMVSLGLYAKSLGQNPFDKKALESSASAILHAFHACQTEEEKIEAFYQFIGDAGEDYIAASFIDKLKSFEFKTLAQHLEYCVKYKKYGVKDTKSTAQEKTECVTLITVHSAKGLEWDNVLLSLKRFPVDEESFRLFYVGVTRAKERLLVSFTEKQQVLADMVS